ncbi:MAG: hypothetical protein ACQESF_07050 [Nanobdellota archaeon]
MRIPDNNYHKLARVQFIYADSLDIMNNLGIDDGEAYLHYEKSAKDILYKPEILVKNHVFDLFTKNTSLTDKIKKLQKERRNNVLKTHEKFRNRSVLTKNELNEIFNSHFGYEQLAIDKFVSEEKFLNILKENLPESNAKQLFGKLMIPYDGKTFFEESNIIRLKYLANKIDPKNSIVQKYDWNWFREKSLTRHRIYDILENYHSIVSKVAAEVDVVRKTYEIKYSSDAIKSIQNIRFKQTRRREEVYQTYSIAGNMSQEINHYLEFLKIALPYNEDVRLIRSASFDIFSRFALQNKCSPKELYREFQLKRQEKFAKQYRPNKYDEIMSQKIISY